MNKPGAERAVQMLIKKLNGEAFRTEYPMPVFDRVEPRPAIADISKATIAHRHLGRHRAVRQPGSHCGLQQPRTTAHTSLDGVTDLRKGEYMTAHGGYDQTYANAGSRTASCPSTCCAIWKRKAKSASSTMCSTVTVGNGTSVANARKFGTEIGSRLQGRACGRGYPHLHLRHVHALRCNARQEHRRYG